MWKVDCKPTQILHKNKACFRLLRSKLWLGNHDCWPHIIIWILTVCYRVLLWRCYTGLKLTSVPWWYLQREKDHPVKWCCERVNARITAPFPFVYTFNFIHIDSSIYTHNLELRNKISSKLGNLSNFTDDREQLRKLLLCKSTYSWSSCMNV